MVVVVTIEMVQTHEVNVLVFNDIKHHVVVDDVVRSMFNLDPVMVEIVIDVGEVYLENNEDVNDAMVDDYTKDPFRRIIQSELAIAEISLVHDIAIDSVGVDEAD